MEWATPSRGYVELSYALASPRRPGRERRFPSAMTPLARLTKRVESVVQALAANV